MSEPAPKVIDPPADDMVCLFQTEQRVSALIKELIKAMTIDDDASIASTTAIPTAGPSTTGSSSPEDVNKKGKGRETRKVREALPQTYNSLSNTRAFQIGH